MNRRGGPRTAQCTAADARTRLTQAGAFCDVAELVLDDRSEIAAPGVAGALAVLSGIAASDAACCAALRRRTRAQDHREATQLLATVRPHGDEMAKKLQRLLASKDDVHYGTEIVSKEKAKRLVRLARDLAKLASAVVIANS